MSPLPQPPQLIFCVNSQNPLSTLFRAFIYYIIAWNSQIKSSNMSICLCVLPLFIVYMHGTTPNFPKTNHFLHQYFPDQQKNSPSPRQILLPVIALFTGFFSLNGQMVFHQLIPVGFVPGVLGLPYSEGVLGIPRAFVCSQQ